MKKMNGFDFTSGENSRLVWGVAWCSSYVGGGGKYLIFSCLTGFKQIYFIQLYQIKFRCGFFIALNDRITNVSIYYTLYKQFSNSFFIKKMNCRESCFYSKHSLYLCTDNNGRYFIFPKKAGAILFSSENKTITFLRINTPACNQTHHSFRLTGK